MAAVRPRFGDWFTNSRFTTEENPRHHGMYVRTVRRRGVMNPGVFYELTDGREGFWLISPDNLTPRVSDLDMEDGGRCVYEVERDRFGVSFSGPLEVGECLRVMRVEDWEVRKDG